MSNKLFDTPKLVVLYAVCAFVQLGAAFGACVAFWSKNARTGWAQTFAAFGGALLFIEGPTELIVRRFVGPKKIFFVLVCFNCLLAYAAVLALGGNTEDSREMPLNRDEIALGFLVTAWGCQLSKAIVTFTHHALVEQNSGTYSIRFDNEA
jgi:hypothetical protein